MRVKFDKKYWTILCGIDKDDRDCYGECVVETHVIRIHPDVSGRKLLGTVIHEALHAEFPWLNEERISQAGYNLEALLYRLGAEVDLPPRK